MIYTKLVIDIETGAVLESEALPYSGPMAWAGGSKKKQHTDNTTTVTLPAPTQEELDQRSKSNAIQDQQLYDAGYQWNPADDTHASTYLTKRALTESEQSDADFDAKMKKYVQDQMTGTISDETRNLVSGIYQSQRDAGNSEIDRFAREGAGARGMDLTTDSPAMREASMAKGNLEGQLRGAESASLLNQGNAQQLFAANYSQFQQQLQQQAFINKQAMQGGYNQNAQQFAQMRSLQPTQTSRTTSYMSGGPSPFLGALNGFMSGLSNPMSGPAGPFTGALAGGLNSKS